MTLVREMLSFVHSGTSLWCETTKNSLVNMTLHCHGNEGTSLFIGAPGITYDFYLNCWFYENGSIEYTLSGGHDGFPNYEVYVGDQRLYGYEYTTHGQVIFSLGPPAEMSGIFASGWVQ